MKAEAIGTSIWPWEERKPQGYVISIVNNKGGVGKTSLACALAHVFSQKKLKTLIVDLDSQCNTTQIMLRDELSLSGRNTIYNLLGKTASIEYCIYPTKEDLFVLPGSTTIGILEPQLILSAPASLDTLHDLTRHFFVSYFDRIIIDCPPNMGMFVLLALYTSDYVLCPINVKSRFSLQGLAEAITVAKKVHQKKPECVKDIRVVPNFVDRRTVSSRETLNAIRQNSRFEQVRLQTVIPQSSLFSIAEAQKKSIVEISRNSPPARAIQALADEISTLWA